MCKSTRFFPTPTAEKPNYPFTFSGDVEFDPLGFVNDRVAKVVEKETKSEPSVWYAKLPDYNYNERFFALNMAAGEVYTFQFKGPQTRIKLPKYKVYKPQLLSKEVENFYCFGKWKKSPHSDLLIENMGRVLLSKVVHLEDDPRAINLGIQTKHMRTYTDVRIMGIDHELSYWPLGFKIIKSNKRKERKMLNDLTLLNDSPWIFHFLLQKKMN